LLPGGEKSQPGGNNPVGGNAQQYRRLLPGGEKSQPGGNNPVGGNAWLACGRHGTGLYVNGHGCAVPVSVSPKDDNAVITRTI
jgi:hypothetical protein